MRLHRLRLQNFRQHALTDLEFGSGVTGIIGPNGVGKSTLLEALAWALYGTPAARGTKDSIRRRGAPPRSRVEVVVEFGLGAHEYRVVRSLNRAELYQDGRADPLANAIGTVNDQITHILGMSRDEFFNTYFTGQKELTVMGAMSPADRGRFLSRVLGYERLRDAQDVLRDRRSELRGRLEAIVRGVPTEESLLQEEADAQARLDAAGAHVASAATTLASAEEALEVTTPRWEAVQRLQEQVRTIESDLRLAEHQVADSREMFTTLDRDLAEAIRARSRFDELAPQVAPMGALREALRTHEAQASALASRRMQIGELGTLKRQRSEVENRIARLPSPQDIAGAATALREAQQALAAAKERADRFRTTWVSDRQEATTRRQQLLDQYADITEQRKRLEEAGPEGACPTCSRPLGEEYADVLAVMDRQLQEVKTNGRYFAQRVEQLSKTPEEVRQADAEQARLDTLVAHRQTASGTVARAGQEREDLLVDLAKVNSQITQLEAALGVEDIGYDEVAHRTVRETIEALEPLALQLERFRDAATRAERLTAQATETEAVLSERERQVLELRATLQGLGWDPEVFQATQGEMRQAEANRREAEVGHTRAVGEHRVANAAVVHVAARRAERAAREAERARIALDLLLNQELDRALADLRTDLNATLRPDLSDMASSFLRDLTAGRYADLELSEAYEATIIDDGVPLEVLSGGEEDLSSLALRLAISQMIAERAGQPLSLLVLDEIFGSLDEDRRGAVLDLLRNLADRFPQVILITHIEGVRDGVDRAIRITYDVERGVSTASEEPLGPLNHAAA